MNSIKYNLFRRVLATCVTLVLLISLLPVPLLAAQVPGFTVTLPAGVSGEATLTCKEDGSDTQTENIVSGQVVFTNDVEGDKVHILSITGMTRYKDYTVEVTPSPGGLTISTGDLTLSPTIDSLEKIPSGWTNGDVTVTGTATGNDLYSIHTVYASTDPVDYTTDTPEFSTTAGVDDVFTFSIQAGQAAAKLYVWAEDGIGQKSLLSDIDLQMENEKPAITNLTITETAATPIGKLINFLTFGTFFNEAIEVHVEATDTGGSGLKKITLHYEESGVEKTMTALSSPAVFTLSPDDLAGGLSYEIWATAEDNAGNESDKKGPLDFSALAQSDEVMLEETEPEITVTPGIAPDYSEGTNDWYMATDIPFTVEIEDSQSGLNSVTIKMTDSGGNTSLLLSEGLTDWGDLTATTTKTFSCTTGPLTEGENKIEVTVKDNARNEKVLTHIMNVDTQEPTVEDFEMEAKDSASPMKSVNFLSYGTFYNDKVLVTVTANDGDGSGIREITLYVDGVSLGAKPAVGGKATFKIPSGAVSGSAVQFDKTLAAKAIDNMGNEMNAVVSPTAVNSKIKSDRLMIENEKPTVGITVPAAVYTDKKNRAWYNASVLFSVSVKDTSSGIRSVEMSLNDEPITVDFSGNTVDAPFYQNRITEKNFTVRTSQATRAEDGSYKLTVTVTDNAGNTRTSTSKIYIDTKNPRIMDFQFRSAAGGYEDSDSKDLSVETTGYGFYFKAKTHVTIYAQDPVPASGVKSISYYTKDIKGEKSKVAIVKTSTGKITIEISANFKGQIYAKAMDNVNNEPKSYVSPDSIIVESPARHREETHIRFKQADTPYQDDSGQPLYAGDTAIGLTVTDTYSGLRSVEWSVTSPYNTELNSSRRIDIDGDRHLKGDAEGWRVTKNERNLVTEMSHTLHVKNNSNDITIWVRITDRAGNTSEESIRFSIDKTVPTVSVIYDNNAPDSDFTDFYNADRTATIVITERNFRREDVSVSIFNTDGAVPELSEWTTVADSSDPDKTTHTASVQFTTDGEYSLDIRCHDSAGHTAAPFTQQTFTIDKTMPVIDVSYDNNQPVNDQYYSVGRNATITITEHNFETGRVQITGTAREDGAGAIFPAAGGWLSNGDVHTATLQCTADAEYTFNIEYTDKAGNRAADYGTDTFVVDQTAPTLEITGVADKSANNGDVAPIIHFFDTNYDPSSVSIELTGAVRQAIPLSGSFSTQHNGQVYTFENFESKKEIDDIYTLSAELTDLAGNRTSETITFSVNRFGSVYVLNQAVEKIEGRYVQEEVDVIVSETNVDTLQRDTLNIKVTHNGVPGDLAEGKDYTVKKSGGNGTWSQYEYMIPKSQFAGEGSYIVTLYSVDTAGNVNENIQESKKAEISFGIDKTPPSIVLIGLEDEQQYPVDNLDAAVSVTDNLVLQNVDIYLNNEKISSRNVENQKFSIPASNAKQSVKIVAVDAAGNESKVEIRGILVTTSIFQRWYNNISFFIGSIVGAGAIVFLVIFLIKKVKGRKEA